MRKYLIKHRNTNRKERHPMATQPSPRPPGRPPTGQPRRINIQVMLVPDDATAIRNYAKVKRITTAEVVRLLIKGKVKWAELETLSKAA